MTFECLANELILDIFEYIHSIELVRLFHGLNTRLNDLLYLYFQNFPLDFRSISKKNFHSICCDILPLISDKILSIHLSNDDDTPDQPNLFLSSFEKFLHLQSLSLYYLHSIDILNKFLSNCSQLIYLNISQCDFDEKISLNQIWNLLPKLKYCYLNEISLSLLTENLSSIHELSIENSILSFDYLISIFKHTPNLQNLNIKLQDTQLFSRNFSKLTKLKLSFQGEFNSLKSLLFNLPNLSKLILHLEHIYIDGYQWEDIIKNSLLKLEIFRLLMFYQYNAEENFIDELFQSFQTKFWIDEHHWYIQYDQNTNDHSFYLYTLPYSFKKFITYSTDLSRSTYPIEQNFSQTNYVHTLVWNNSLSRKILEFTNIIHLELKFPFNEIFWTVIPKLNQLKTLEIVSITHSDDIDESITQLSLLLNQANNLNSLTIDYLILSQLSTIEINNKYLTQLDLMSIDGHFYDNECINLIETLLNNQCEILLINIETRSIILDLIEKLSNLRALTFQCQDDQWGDSYETSFNDDELLLWLKTHLPTNCFIIRDEREMSIIRLWIR